MGNYYYYILNMFKKLTTALVALAASVSAQNAQNATIPKWTPCDSQMSCNTVLSTTGATCYSFMGYENNTSYEN